MTTIPPTDHIAQVQIDIPELIQSIIDKSQSLDPALYTPSHNSLLVHDKDTNSTRFNFLGAYLMEARQLPFRHTVQPDEFTEYALAPDLYANIYVVACMIVNKWNYVIAHDTRFSKDSLESLTANMEHHNMLHYSDWSEYSEMLQVMQVNADTLTSALQ